MYAHDGGQILWADNAGAANLKTNGFGTAVLAKPAVLSKPGWVMWKVISGLMKMKRAW